MIIIVAWIESDTDKIKIKIELHSLRSSDLLCQEWIVAIYKTDTIARLQISFILLQNTYSVQYTIYIRVRTHARVYMRMYVQCCKWRVCGVFICGVMARMDSKMFRLYCKVVQSIRIFMWILLFKVKSTYLSNIMHDNYKT